MAHEQWTITLALAPLTLLLFGQFSVVGLLANALAIPWITLVVTPLAMLGVLLPWRGMASTAIAVLMAVLQWMAALPGATVALARARRCGWGCWLFWAAWPWCCRGRGACACGVRHGCCRYCCGRHRACRDGQFELLAPDIGQGNAVLVRTAGHALLYDAGPRYSLESDAGHRVIVPLQALQVRLDTLVLSHRDTDHVGGAAAVLAQQPQANWIGSLANDSNAILPRPGVRCEAGMHWQWDGVRFEVLHPPGRGLPAGTQTQCAVVRAAHHRR